MQAPSTVRAKPDALDVISECDTNNQTADKSALVRNCTAFAFTPATVTISNACVCIFGSTTCDYAFASMLGGSRDPTCDTHTSWQTLGKCFLLRRSLHLQLCCLLIGAHCQHEIMLRLTEFLTHRSTACRQVQKWMKVSSLQQKGKSVVCYKAQAACAWAAMILHHICSSAMYICCVQHNAS